MLRDFPDNEPCFVDANILYYHFVETPPFSEICSDFLERIGNGKVTGYSSTAVLAEAVHKVMLAEAASRWNLPRQGLVSRLKRQSNLISPLSEHLRVIPTVYALNFRIEPITLDLLNLATQISIQHTLLTNDALMVAVMQRNSLSHLATNDDDFDTISNLTIWKPRPA